MAIIKTDNSHYTNIANTIRSRIGTETQFKPSEMPQGVESVYNAGYEKGKAEGGTSKPEQEKKVTINKNGTTEVLPDEGKTLSKVNIEVDVPSDNVLVNEQGRFYVKNPVVPEGVTELADFAFHNCEIDTIKLPTTLTTVRKGAFAGTNIQEVDFSKIKSLSTVLNNAFYCCLQLQEVDFSSNDKLREIQDSAFSGCTSVLKIILPNGLEKLGNSAFSICENLKWINLPNTLKSAGWFPLYRGKSLEFVEMEDGFNLNNFELSNSTLYSVETIVSWGEALFDRTGLDPYTLTIGSENIEKLSDEQKLIFTDKNWILK